MLKLYKRDATESRQLDKFICGLPEAAEVKVSQEINAQYSLSFSFPLNVEKYKDITVGRIVDCEGQLYRIMKASRDEGSHMLGVDCLHVYDADAAVYHIPTISVMSGVSPRTVMEKAFNGTGFSVMTENEVEALGMHWVGYDGFLIDFETTDKTSPYSVVNSIIDIAGIGEIYRDNYKVAIVTYLGGTERGKVDKSDRLRLTVGKNLSALTVTYDISSMVNRLYAYGYEDLTIKSVNLSGNPYIEDTSSIETYGLKMGYKDYSDAKKASDVYSRALWEFSDSNEYRINKPSVTIEGKIIDLSKLPEYDKYKAGYGVYKTPSLGMTAEVTDTDGTVYTERITKIEYYPYEPGEMTATIGHIQKDEVFYLTQLGKSLGCNWRIR